MLSPGDPVSRATSTRLPSGVSYAVVQEGVEEAKPRAGAEARVHITCWVEEKGAVGRQFWSSRQGAVPQLESYVLDPMQLVPGLIDLLSDMTRGERRLARIPASQAYGELGYGDLVPPNASILVDVELVSFRNP